MQSDINDIAMEAIQDALYATNNFTSEQCNKIADGILQYLDDYYLKIINKLNYKQKTNVMREIINKLKREVEHKERMLGTTAPTQWLRKKTQKEWDKSQQYKIKQLRKAIRILESTL